MGNMGTLGLAAVAFVGSHLLLSHPLRRPLVGAIGERPFLGLYSLVAFATLGWLIVAYGAAPASDPLWTVGNGIWVVVSGRVEVDSSGSASVTGLKRVEGSASDGLPSGSSPWS